ncbi:Hsp20/alpha crystallin family protein [Oesophagostomum dentatum]|uniref:Hsp20/alpha crystallin family protein n=1 Tax=Oesophagostomum dentatum TaxID=61180 RepID=A0A0B1SS49_OESDE|nr:Hsp20/alpha crystallin family protein [Oesophagostomum dentatum]
MSMEIWQMPRIMNRMMNEYMRDFDRAMYPYWRDADHSILHVANDTQQLVDDDKHFAVNLDVSQFRPEELKVHLDGRELTVEGKQEHKGDNSFIHRKRGLGGVNQSIIMSMEIWQMPRIMNRMMNENMRDFDRDMYPYWRDADHSILHVANDTQQLVDDDKHFAVNLDVSQFRPEELKVHLDGRELTVEGKQEHKGDNSFIHRSFVRKWTLPENVDLEAVQTQLSDKGHLCVEAPKTDAAAPHRRNIPIMAAPKK